MLYFAYTALIDPDLISEVSPGASFQFIAHLPETKLFFPIKDRNWKGGLPSVAAESGNTVWGAVFEVPDKEVAALDAVEAKESREPTSEFSAIDREGTRYQVLTHAQAPPPNGTYDPSTTYMERVVRGARHWDLPMGWIVGLEEYAEDPLF